MLLQLLLLLLLLLGCCCFLVDFHVDKVRGPRHSAQRIITSKVTSVRGPERHDSASLRVTTAPHVMQAEGARAFSHAYIKVLWHSIFWLLRLRYSAL